LLVSCLSHVGRPRAEGQQPFQLGVLVPVHRVDVNVQRKPPRARVGAGAQDDCGLQSPEPGIGWTDLDRPVLPVKFLLAQHVTPEPREQFGVGTIEDQFTDSA